MILGIEQTVLFELLGRFIIDIITMLSLTFGMYYRRYRDKELVTVASLFNIFAFAVLIVLSSVEFSVTVGFGLFAILALFTLRSEQISKTEITYFFGSVSIAVITAILGTSLPFVILVAFLVLLGAFVIDHPSILKSVDGLNVTLDKVDVYALTNPDMMRADLSKRLGVEVLSYRIIMIDYINEMVKVNVYYHKQ